MGTHAASGQVPSVPERVTPPPAKDADALAEARKMIDRGRSEDALKVLDGLAAQQPIPAGVDTLRGIAFYAQSRFADADAAFAIALKKDARDEEATQLRGLTLFRLGKPAEAIPFLEAAHKWTPETKTDPSYVLLSAISIPDGTTMLAMRSHRSIGFAVDSAAAYLLAARMLLRREYVPVAKEFANKALELDPQIPLAHALLGEQLSPESIWMRRLLSSKRNVPGTH